MRRECKAHFKKISEYLDGELDPGTMEEIESHLSECPECRDCIDSLRKTIRLCKQASPEGMPDAMKRQLHETLRQCLEGHPSR